MISWRQRVRELEAEIAVLKQKNEELERRLLAYENAHTPPSRRYKPRQPPVEAGNRGAPIGHKGATRVDPPPTMRVEHTLKRCSHCQARLGKPSFTESKLVEEIPEPQPIEVTEHIIPHYTCPHCGKENSADIPVLGRFGPRTCAHVALLKFSDRLPHVKVVQALSRQFGLTMTPPTVLRITQRVADATRASYEGLLQQLLKEPYIQIDETPLRVSGRTYWVWIFTTPQMTLYVVRPSRGRNVVQDILHDYKGVIVTDGYTVYEGIGGAQQRCWAHLLREAEFLASKHVAAKPVLEQLRQLYREARTLTKRRIDRVAVHDALMLRMRQLIEICGAYKELRKFATTLVNGIHSWFIAILHKGVPLTNNLAERQLREIVVQRKIFGTLRTDRGCTTLETIMSLIMTWKQTGKDALQELVGLLSPTGA